MSEVPLRCESCSTPIPAEASFCPTCGNPTPTRIVAGESSGEAEAEFRERLQRALGEDYELGELIGRGGFGVVHVARDRRLEREVAVKALRFDLFPTAELLERFQREARAVAKLRHPNIIPIYSVGEGAGLTYMLMPRIRGETLRSLLRREGRLAVSEALRIGRETASALGAAHSQGIIHRDVKPDNILLEGDTRRVLVTDFGIAKALHEEDSTLTSGQRVLGTPQYLSPEQAKGEAVDNRTDVYSLGCVLYEMLAGDPPFTGQSVEGILARHLTASPTPLHLVRKSVSPQLASAVGKALAKVPAERFDSMESFLAALQRPGRALGRPVRSALLSVILVVAGVIGAVWVFWPTLDDPEASGFRPAPTHRQVTFTGHANSPDLSRDGNALAFQNGGEMHVGEIGVLELAGERVLSLARWGSDPQWTSDASHVRFRSRSNDVSVVHRLGGSVRTLCTGCEHRGFSADESGEAWVTIQHLPGHRSHLVTRRDSIVSDTIVVDGLRVEEIDWFGASLWVALVRTPENAFELALLASTGEVLDRRPLEGGGGPSPVLAPRTPRWTQAGDAVLLAQDGRIWKYGVDVTDMRFDGEAASIFDAATVSEIDLVGETDRLAYVRLGGRSRVVILEVVHGADGEWALVEEDLTTGTQWSGDAAISSDGEKVAFVRGQPGLAQDLYVLTEREERRITTLQTPLRAPIWAPDGEALAFQIRDSTGWSAALESSGSVKILSACGDDVSTGWRWIDASVLVCRNDGTTRAVDVRNDRVVEGVDMNFSIALQDPMRMRRAEGHAEIERTPERVIRHSVRIIKGQDNDTSEVILEEGSTGLRPVVQPFSWIGDSLFVHKERPGMRGVIGARPLDLWVIDVNRGEVLFKAQGPACTGISAALEQPKLVCSVEETAQDIWIADHLVY